ncbi:hypothetical protein DPM19_00095 [Actinomadura craniellae]|uniref:Uncharacterized protein n=1 Tax=Actinomadura craniellae TaxID=2231787 RepID=A0A365HC98_9ACTN|nr:hypothetical protein [Actinomadura craniellae]RAY16628.1 hypothetical protein DPM19_00095 [Actinomadura craniellae]
MSSMMALHRRPEMADRPAPEPAPARRPPGRIATGDPEHIAVRLAAEFPFLDRHTISTCVRDTCNCLAHLGIAVSPDVIERLAREHLTTLASSPLLEDPVPFRDVREG